MKNSRSLLKRASALAVALLLIVWTCALPIFAASTASSTDSASSTAESSASSDGTSYIRTWDEYTKVNKPAYGDTWMFHDIKDAVVDVLEAGKKAIEAGDYETARQAGSDGYYGFYDLAFENATNMYISGSRVKQMELLFGQLRGSAASQGSLEEYEQICDEIESNMEEDANILDGGDLDGASSGGSTESTAESTASGTETSGTTTTSGSSGSSGSSTSMSTGMLVFFGTFFDILREGVEAIIVVAGIVAYLRVQVKNGDADKKKTLYPTYWGSILGIACSFVMAWILNLIRNATGSSSHQQEFIEGFTALLAVCVLFWTCNWMLSKSETEAWTAYLKSKTQSSVQRGSVIGLAVAAFLAVFREGAEAVLFLQQFVSSNGYSGAVIAGLIVAGICLVIIYMLVTMLSVKLPMRIFFNATSILMAIMCVCFLGQGISAMIEAEVFNAYSAPWVAWIPFNTFLDILGIYPYVNTIVPQIILAVVLIIMFHYGFKKNRAIRKEAEAKKAEQDAIEAAEAQKKADEEFRRKVTDIVLSVLSDQKLIAAKPAKAADTPADPAEPSDKDGKA